MSRASALAHRYQDVSDDDRGVRVREAASRRVLIIEDNKSDVLLIKRMLHEASEDDGLQYIDVPRMVDALEILDGTAFDLILLDLNLLDIEGAASVAALRVQVPNIPIIVYSGSDDAKLKQEALICGAKHYLVKGKESPYGVRFMIRNTLATYA